MRVLLSCPVFLSKGQTFQQFCTKHTGNRCERIQKRPLFYRIHDVDKKIPDFPAIMWGTFLPVPLRFVPCAKWLTDRCRIFSLHFNRLALHCELSKDYLKNARLYIIDMRAAHRERYRKTPTPPTGFSCPLGVFTQVVLGVVFRQSTTASKPLKRRPAIIGRACAGLNCRVNARKSPTL